MRQRRRQASQKSGSGRWRAKWLGKCRASRTCARDPEVSAPPQYDSTKRRERKATRAVTGRAAAAAGPSHAATAEAGSSHGRARQHAVKTKVRASKRKAADARVGGASAKHRLITLRLLAHSLLLRAFVSATAQPQAQDSSRRSRSADLRVSSTPFGAAAVASSGAASAHDSQALAAEVQAAPQRFWFASWPCASSAPEITSSCTTCTSRRHL